MFSSDFRKTGSIALVVCCALTLSACADTMGGWFGKKEATVAAVPDAPLPTLAKPTKNSSIPVLVNDVPITEYDVNQRLHLDRLGSGGKPVSRDTAIDELIDETLESLEAQRQNVVVPDAQVDAAFANISQHMKLTPAGLGKALASQGVDASSLKKRLRAQMMWQTLVQRRTATKAQVTNQDVRAAIQAKGDDAAKATEFTLQQIIFVVPKGSPASLTTQRRSEAEAFRQRFTGCENSMAQAKPLRGVVVKDIGRRTSTDLTGPSGETVQKTKPGTTTPPEQSDEGVLLIAVCSTRDIQSTAAVRNEAQNNLFIKQADDLGKDFLKELRDRAIIERR